MCFMMSNTEPERDKETSEINRVQEEHNLLMGHNMSTGLYHQETKRSVKVQTQACLRLKTRQRKEVL